MSSLPLGSIIRSEWDSKKVCEYISATAEFFFVGLEERRVYLISLHCILVM